MTPRIAISIGSILLVGLLIVGPARAEEPQLAVEPGSFFAKTHGQVPFLQPGGGTSERRRHADVDGLLDAEPVTRAGAHPDGTTSFSLEEPTGVNRPYARDIHVELPPGFVADPGAVEECRRDLITVNPVESEDPGSVAGGLCPPSSQVGMAFLDLRPAQPLMSAPVYRVPPAFGSPAAFAFKAAGQLIVLDPRLRSESDYGITVESSNISQSPYALYSATIVVWGVPGDGSVPGEGHYDDRLDTRNDEWGIQAGVSRRPFWINPSRCDTGDLPTNISMRAWYDQDRWVPEDWEPGDAGDGPDDYVDFAPEPTGCEAMPDYEGEIEMQPVSREAGQPSGYNATLTQPYNDDPDGIAFPYLKKAEVELPEGVTVSPSAANGLEACTEEEAGFGTEHEASCPAASKIGEVEVETPLLDATIPGSIHIASPTPDQLLRVFIILQHERYGVTVRVSGEVDTDPDTGQLTAVFDDNPQLPFTDMDIEFHSGSMASLVNPSDCGTHEVVTTLTAWNGDSNVSRTPYEISSDGRGGDCPPERPFEPELDANTVNGLAGANTPLFTGFQRSDADEQMSSVSVDMPEGLLARIAGVPLCPSGNADAGTCGEGSRIGHVQIASGAGDRPYRVPGPGKDPTAVYLSGPYQGAPYSLSIVVEAQAGPFDLGRVVVRNPIEVDDRTAELSIGLAESRVYDRFGDLDRVIDDRMPTILEGIPLRVKEIRVIVDREEFMVNPTNCSAKQIEARIGASDGRFTEVVSPFRATDCQALDFAPRFGMRILNPGRRSTVRSFNPAMRFGVAPRQGHANISAAAVTLPSSIILDQSNIRTVCTRDQFAARECPEAAIYGYARAWSPLLKEPIQGPVYLGSSDNQLPDLIADMRGEVRVILQGEILGTRDGRIRNVFRFVPDAAVSRFQLNMLGGANRGVLVNSRDLCRSGERGVSRFIGQNGKRQVGRHRVGLSFRGCRQVRRQAAVRQIRQRQALRKAVRTGSVTPAQARRAVRS